MKTPEEIQELAIAKYGTGIYSIDEVDAYVVGYTQCQNDMADEIATLKMLCQEYSKDVKALNNMLDKIINSLNKQDNDNT